MQEKTKAKTSVSKFQRLYKIFKWIEQGGKPTAEELARKFECSIDAIYKDINDLKYGYCIKIGKIGNRGGYYFEDENPHFPMEDKIFESNLNVLSSAKFLLEHFENTPVYADIEKTLNEICSLKSDSPLLNRIALAPTTNPTKKVEPYTWKTICEGLSNNQILKFFYQPNNWDPELENDFLHVRPYQLLIDEGKNLLFGYLEEKEDLRLFDLNKISNLTATREKFDLPKDFDFKNHTGNSNFGAFTRYAARKYKIAFYEDAMEEIKMGNWAKDQVIEKDVDEDGNERLVVSFTSSQDMKILDWVFQNKAYAKPLEPESLVLRWKFNIAVMAKMAGFNVQVDYSLLEKAEKLEREGL